MLKEIHFLLTYSCNFECDHCFLYSGPEAEGTFTLAQLRELFDEIPRIGSIERVYFEGGESFLFYPLLLEGIRMARDRGLEVGIVTNAYWATSAEDAELWMRPLPGLGISDFSISDDSFHSGENEDSPAQYALEAGKRLEMPTGTICIEEPSFDVPVNSDRKKGEAVVGGGVMFRGRAAEKLTEGLPRRRSETLTECPYEDLEDPKRVHVDSYGNVHLCQGVLMGNVWETPLSTLLKEYDALSHPITGPLVRGGPALLAKEHNVPHEDEYVDECHFCYLSRRALIDKFPQFLAPRQVYGM